MRIKIIFVFIGASILSGCATPMLHKVESVRVCASNECGVASESYSAKQMIGAIQHLVEANYGEDIKFCESEPKSRECVNPDVCMFTQGGPFPGLSCLKSFLIAGVPKQENASTENQNAENRIEFQSTPRGTFLGIPLYFGEKVTAITVRSADEILFDNDTHAATWLVFPSAYVFSLAVDSIDFDKGIIGGYWHVTTSGTGWTNSTGYGLFSFPKGMGKGGWLAPVVNKESPRKEGS